MITELEINFGELCQRSDGNELQNEDEGSSLHLVDEV